MIPKKRKQKGEMKTFKEAVRENFTWKSQGFWSFEFSDGFELTLEPLIFEQQHYLALYQGNRLIFKSKVPIKPGK